jgi:biopolymer transport protein ExbD
VEVGGAPVDAKDVRAAVADRVGQDPDLVVVLATSPDASYGVMVNILDQLKLARCRRISLKSLE